MEHWVAEVAELADALDSKSSVVTPRAGSSPAFGTSKFKASRSLREAYFFSQVYSDSLFDSRLYFSILILYRPEEVSKFSFDTSSGLFY